LAEPTRREDDFTWGERLTGVRGGAGLEKHEVFSYPVFSLQFSASPFPFPLKSRSGKAETLNVKKAIKRRMNADGRGY
jgi:hypothetical protein